jgi:hypothetical protein
MGTAAALAARTTFPGRVRQFACPHPGHATALAVGAAWSEAARGGHACAVVPPERRGDPLVAASLALADRLGLANLHLLDAVDPAVPSETLAPCERQPVQLPSLGRDLVPRWGAVSPSAALAATAAAEPLLLLPARDARWGCGPAALLALAWIAGDGRRVVWELPPTARPGDWAAELALIGRLQLPLKLVCALAQIPWPPIERGLARWWVAAAGTHDAAGVLAWALAGEEPVLAALPERMEPGEAWLPGAPRQGPARDGAWRVSLPGNQEPGPGELHLVGLVPPPIDALRAAGQLSTGDEDIARHLAPLAALDPALRCPLAPAPRDLG